MVSDLVDEQSDVRVNRKMELVRTSQTAGNAMIGIAYLTAEDAALVTERIVQLVEKAAYDDSFLEEALYKKDRMIVVHACDVVEINTYEQLRDLDSDSEQLKSDAIAVIAEQLQVNPKEIVEISVLKKGMTNRSFLFSCKGKKYIMRIPGEGTSQLISRKEEADVYRAISRGSSSM